MELDPAMLRIVHFPDPVLRRKCAPVGAVDDQIRVLVERMFFLMREAEGIGLAAPQVGVPVRVFVTAAHDEHPDRVFINPVLTGLGDDLETAEEGCLSLPGINADIRRAPAASITATGLDGAEFALHAEGLTARIWQHEFDHIEGILIIDRMSPMNRIANRKTIKDLQASAEGG